MSVKISDLEVLLWSQKSKTFHIEKFAQTITHGQRSFVTGSPPDYIVVGASYDMEGIRQIRQTLTDARPDWSKE